MTSESCEMHNLPLLPFPRRGHLRGRFFLFCNCYPTLCLFMWLSTCMYWSLLWIDVKKHLFILPLLILFWFWFWHVLWYWIPHIPCNKLTWYLFVHKLFFTFVCVMHSSSSSEKLKGVASFIFFSFIVVLPFHFCSVLYLWREEKTQISQRWSKPHYDISRNLKDQAFLVCLKFWSLYYLAVSILFLMLICSKFQCMLAFLMRRNSRASDHSFQLKQQMTVHHVIYNVDRFRSLLVARPRPLHCITDPCNH